MGLMDNLKGKAEELKEKASELAGKHSDQIEHAVDKAGGAIDKATKGKYSEKIEHGTSKAKHAVDDFAHKPGGPGGTTPGTPVDGQGPTPEPALPSRAAGQLQDATRYPTPYGASR